MGLMKHLYLSDLISNLAGANYALGEYAILKGDGMTPDEEMISDWKQAGRPEEFRGFDREGWELANEIRKTNKKIRREIKRLKNRVRHETVMESCNRSHQE
jgi:hypothetical protein